MRPGTTAEFLTQIGLWAGRRTIWPDPAVRRLGTECGEVFLLFAAPFGG